MVDNQRAELELAVFGKVYELLLSHPIRSAFREDDDGPDGEPPPTDPEMLVAVQADRFDLCGAIRELRRKAQQELFGGEFTDTARCALLWVLWHHQGGSSDVGQAMRFALGKGAHEHLSEDEIAQAKKWDALRIGSVNTCPARDPLTLAKQSGASVTYPTGELPRAPEVTFRPDAWRQFAASLSVPASLATWTEVDEELKAILLANDDTLHKLRLLVRRIALGVMGKENGNG